MINGRPQQQAVTLRARLLLCGCWWSCSKCCPCSSCGGASSEMPFVNSQELFCARVRVDHKSTNDGWIWLCSLTSPPRAGPPSNSPCLALGRGPGGWDISTNESGIHGFISSLLVLMNGLAAAVPLRRWRPEGCQAVISWQSSLALHALHALHPNCSSHLPPLSPSQPCCCRLCVCKCAPCLPNGLWAGAGSSHWHCCATTARLI